MSILVTIFTIILIIAACVILYKHFFVKNNKGCTSCKGCPFANSCGQNDIYKDLLSDSDNDKIKKNKLKH